MTTMSGSRGTAGQSSPVYRHLENMRLRGLSAMTIRHRDLNLAQLAAFLAPAGLLDATAADLMAWRASLDLANATIAVYVSHIQMFYLWALQTGLIAADPAAGLPVPRLSRRLPRPISEQDLLYAVRNAPPRVRPWLVLAAWCGLRAKEIALLRSENIMLRAERPVILVAADATKGVKERTVPLSAFAVAELVAAGLPPAGLAFCRVDGAPMPPNLVSKLCNSYLRDCGIAATLHQLRHRFGSQIYAAGQDILVTQALLGHSSPQTTAGYAAWSKASAIAAVEALPVPDAVASLPVPPPDEIRELLTDSEAQIRNGVSDSCDHEGGVTPLMLVGGRLWEAMQEGA
jgi:site-specific recombinase XerD